MAIDFGNNPVAPPPTSDQLDQIKNILAIDTGVQSDPTGVTGADAVTNMMSLTQAEYDAIGSPSATTLYLITD